MIREGWRAHLRGTVGRELEVGRHRLAVDAADQAVEGVLDEDGASARVGTASRASSKSASPVKLATSATKVT